MQISLRLSCPSVLTFLLLLLIPMSQIVELFAVQARLVRPVLLSLTLFGFLLSFVSFTGAVAGCRLSVAAKPVKRCAHFGKILMLLISGSRSIPKTSEEV